MLSRTIRIIGIDPGLRRTGWGIIESDGVRLSYVASGLITSDADNELAYRLRELYEGISSVLASFKPAEAAVEETFVNENAKATLKLGQARGIAMRGSPSADDGAEQDRDERRTFDERVTGGEFLDLEVHRQDAVLDGAE